MNHGFLSHLHSLAVTMSQKSSLIQFPKSVSQALTLDTRQLPLLLELPHRPALENHVDRNPGLGPWVLINEKRYNTIKLLSFDKFS